MWWEWHSTHAMTNMSSIQQLSTNANVQWWGMACWALLGRLHEDSLFFMLSVCFILPRVKLSIPALSWEVMTSILNSLFVEVHPCFVLSGVKLFILALSWAVGLSILQSNLVSDPLHLAGGLTGPSIVQAITGTSSTTFVFASFSASSSSKTFLMASWFTPVEGAGHFCRFFPFLDDFRRCSWQPAPWVLSTAGVDGNG